MSIFETINLTTAKEFVDVLRPSSEIWAVTGKWSPRWYFRGQSNSEWKLTPSAWRQNTNTESERIVSQTKREIKAALDSDIRWKIQNRWKEINKPNYSTDEYERAYEVILQAYTEFSLVHEFIQFADSLGYPAPGATELPQKTDKFLDDYICNLYQQNGTIADNIQVWNNRAFALAQHHGIPTRILDWTSNPLTAGYFAVEGARPSEAQDTLLAVFAVPQAVFKYHMQSIQVPRFENAYLKAQAGSFSVDTRGDKYYIQTGEWFDFDRSLTEERGWIMPEAITPRKITLPITEAPELFPLLWREGVTRAHLMPTYDNITTALKTKWEWIAHSKANSL